MKKTGWPMAAAALAALIGAATGMVPPALAGDYANSCATADPRFEIQDEVLSLKGGGESIPYDMIEKRLVSERRGYCLSRGQRFGFEARTSNMRIRFAYNGSTIETTATCEFASSGLPAAYDCEREVVTYDSTGDSTGGGGSPDAGRGPVVASCGSGTLWDHNGSTMRLLASGSSRRFAYERPRQGVVRAGVSQCDVVFQGEKQGDRYIGTAYVYSRDCGPSGYPVSGPVSGDGLTVTLFGKAPRRRDDCSVSGYRDDRLVFTYVRSD